MATLQLESAMEWIKHDIRAPRIAVVIGAILLFWSMVATVRQFWALPAIPVAPAVKVAPVQAAVDLAQYHIFGNFASSLQNLPETTLQLTLQGTEMNVSSPQNSWAVIASPNGDAKIYTVGDRVPGGATIKAIQRDRIIMDNAGRLESLLLPVPKLKDLQELVITPNTEY